MLHYAMLCYAMLCYAVLCCAVLCCAVLCCALLRCASLIGNLSFCGRPRQPGPEILKRSNICQMWKSSTMRLHARFCFLLFFCFVFGFCACASMFCTMLSLTTNPMTLMIMPLMMPLRSISQRPYLHTHIYKYIYVCICIFLFARVHTQMNVNHAMNLGDRTVWSWGTREGGSQPPRRGVKATRGPERRQMLWKTWPHACKKKWPYACKKNMASRM